MKNIIIGLLIIVIQEISIGQVIVRDHRTNKPNKSTGQSAVQDNRNGSTTVNPSTSQTPVQAKQNTGLNNIDRRTGASISAKPNSGGYIYDPARQLYTRVQAGSTINKKPAAFVIGMIDGQKGYLLGANSNSWFEPTKEQITEISNAKKDKLIEIKLAGGQGYPYYQKNGKQNTAPEKTLKITQLNESVEHIGKLEAKNLLLEAKEGKFAVYYFNKLSLGYITFKSGDFVIVADTLYLKQPKPLENAFISVNNDKRTYLRILANTVIYEGPTTLTLPVDADVDFRVRKTFLKTHFQNINSKTLKPLPIAAGWAGKDNNVYLSAQNTEDKILLNRLYIRQMNQMIGEFNLTADPWILDKKIERFQTIRYQKMNPEVMASDAQTQNTFNSLCRQFDSNYKNYIVQSSRKIGNQTILIDGSVTKIPISPLKYYALPSQAKVMAKLKDSTTAVMGTLSYQNTGDTKMFIEIDAELSLPNTELKSMATELEKLGIKLENKLSPSLLKIDEQPLKIFGKTAGKIFPISNNLLRLQINVTDNTKDINDLFSKIAPVNFALDYKIAGNNQLATLNLAMVVEPVLLAKFNYQSPISNFEIYDRSKLTGTIELVNNLNANGYENEGALDHVEAIVELKFDNVTEVHGPFTLSAYSTMASKIQIPFLAKSPAYQATISGRVLYQNGEREIKPFTVTDQIISIDERAINP